jgi:serine protease Do
MRAIILSLLLPTTVIAAQPLVIDDQSIFTKFQNSLGKLADKKEAVPISSIAAMLKKAPTHANLAPTADPQQDASYDNLTRSVYLIGTVYKCSKCSHWHSGSIATAWCLTEDGIFVTNEHVLREAKGAAFGVCDRDGHVFPFAEVIAADPVGDVALFRVKGNGFKPIRIGEAPAVGTKIHVISNPDGRLFLQTSGEVGRYFRAHARREGDPVWMTVTADYAQGSSGGPVCNERGEVVGMVCYTETISYGTDAAPGPVQMVVKNCVSVATIRELAYGTANKTVQITPVTH